MKQLLTRISGLEESVRMVVDRIAALKEENDKLSIENNRLHTELNQLRKSGLGHSSKDEYSEGTNVMTNKSDIDIDLIKNELDQCIEEIEACLEVL